MTLSSISSIIFLKKIILTKLMLLHGIQFNGFIIIYIIKGTFLVIFQIKKKFTHYLFYI